MPGLSGIFIRPSAYSSDSFVTSLRQVRTTEEEGYELFCDRYSIYVEEIEFIYVPTAAIIDAKGFAEEIMANDPDVQDAEVKEKDGLVYCEYELYYSLYKLTNYYLTFFYEPVHPVRSPAARERRQLFLP